MNDHCLHSVTYCTPWLCQNLSMTQGGLAIFWPKEGKLCGFGTDNGEGVQNTQKLTDVKDVKVTQEDSQGTNMEQLKEDKIREGLSTPAPNLISRVTVFSTEFWYHPMVSVPIRALLLNSEYSVNVAMSFLLQAHRGQTLNIVPSAGRDLGSIFTA